MPQELRPTTGGGYPPSGRQLGGVPGVVPKAPTSNNNMGGCPPQTYTCGKCYSGENVFPYMILIAFSYGLVPPSIVYG